MKIVFCAWGSLFVSPQKGAMNVMSGVMVCLGALGAAVLLSLPWLGSLSAGLVVCAVWGGSWKFAYVALRTIRRDLM